MKRLILLLIILSCNIELIAQTIGIQEKGYRGYIAFGGDVGVTKGLVSNSFSLLTSHGFSTGEGGYVGVGTGIKYEWSNMAKLPVFVEAKYNFFNAFLSPFADCRIGGEVIFGEERLGGALVISPALGVDFSRFGIRVGYLCEAGRYVERDLQDGRWHKVEDVLMKLHSVSVSLTYSF